MNYKVPSIGLILIGRRHPYWDKMLETEKEAGNQIVKRADGRYYSEAKTKESKSDIQPEIENIKQMLEGFVRKYEAPIEPQSKKTKKMPAYLEEKAELKEGLSFIVNRDMSGFIKSIDIKKKEET